ncbi:ATP-binding protein [Pedobacter sp. P351]|uniref:ATP-binding protein n=1 Tax=Pedobacter superstes TaxID=3133441 RepID=UPI0030A13F5D
MPIKKISDDLILAYQELAYQKEEQEKKAGELIVANIERDFQLLEKEKRASELILANIELDFQTKERDKRAAELAIANIERAFQNEEKEKRAAELMIANTKLLLQNEEKEKRAAELIVANKELIFQNSEKEKRAAELVIANQELIFQNREKEKRAAEMVLANKELAAQNQELELNKRKDEFIGIASHEVKTPLTSISAYLQIMQRNQADDKNKIFIDKALRQVKKLSGLISDLLDISKIEAGKLTLNLSTFDICELTKEVIEIIEFGGIQHKIESTFIPKGLLVHADKHRIEQVINNLISNSIKYSPHSNRIVILVSQSDTDVLVSVQDFGTGIREDQQTHIFSRFYRAEDVAPHISGLGLGLYICDDIISRHKGLLGVVSKPGAGSTFSFKIPKVSDKQSDYSTN